MGRDKKYRICNICCESFTGAGNVSICPNCFAAGKKIKCANCGRDFTRKAYNAVYCTARCRGIAQTIKDRAIKEKRKLSKNYYFDILQRDKFRCVYCGKNPIDDGVKLVIDHVFPRNKGGKSNIYNLVTSCQLCNSVKVDKLFPEELIIEIWSKAYDRSKSINYEEIENDFKKRYGI